MQGGTYEHVGGRCVCECVERPLAYYMAIFIHRHCHSYRFQEEELKDAALLVFGKLLCNDLMRVINL